MRRAARTDGNHAQIMAALVKAGIRVLSLAPMGKGCPDLLCGLRGVNVLLEVKDPAQDPNKRALTPAERHFHETWAGQVCVVETAEQAVLAVVEAARPPVEGPNP